MLSPSSVTPSALNRGCVYLRINVTEERVPAMKPPPHCWELDQAVLGHAPAWCGHPLRLAWFTSCSSLWVSLYENCRQGGTGVCLGWAPLGCRHQESLSPTWWRSLGAHPGSGGRRGAPLIIPASFWWGKVAPVLQVPSGWVTPWQQRLPAVPEASSLVVMVLGFFQRAWPARPCTHPAPYLLASSG